MKKETSLNPFEFVTAEEVEKSIFRLVEASKKISKFKPDVVNGIAQKDIKEGEVISMSIEEYCKVTNKE